MMNPSRNGRIRSLPQKIGGKPDMGSSSLASEKLPFGDAQLDDGAQQESPHKAVASRSAGSLSWVAAV